MTTVGCDLSRDLKVKLNHHDHPAIPIVRNVK